LDFSERDKKGGKEEEGVMGHADESRRTQDIGMFQLYNARQRRLDEWKELFTQADSRFRFESASQPTGSHLWIIEFSWSEE
jgi:hypothetical protein